MASVNKVILLGNVGNDPEMRYLPSGAAVAHVTLATTDTWKDKQSGDKKESTQWHRVTFFNRLAEIVGQYIKKGSSIYIEGGLKYSQYEKDGITKYSTEITATSMQMLGKKNDSSGSFQPAPNQQQNSNAGASTPPNINDDDDVPF